MKCKNKTILTDNAMETTSPDEIKLINKIYALEEKIIKKQGSTKKTDKIITIMSWVYTIFGGFLTIVACATGSSWGNYELTGGLAIIVVTFLIRLFKYVASFYDLQTQLDNLLTIDEESIEFYFDCLGNIKKGEKITNVLSIVGQKYGYNYLALAQKYFKKGEQEVVKKAAVEKYKKEKENRDKLIELHRKEQLDASAESVKRLKTGKEKYLVELRKWIDLIETQKKIAKNLRIIGNNNMSYTATTKDSAIIGGMASALGGTVVGVGAAITVEAKNELARERAKRKRDLAPVQLGAASKIERGAINEAGSAYEYLQLMKNVLIDEKDIKEKFKLLEISNINISLTEGNNLCVKFELRCLKKATILSNPAIFDGVLKLSIYNNKNKLVSTGYYVADGYGEYNYRYAGFYDKQDIQIICPIDSIVNLDDLRCEITPEALWFIEKNESVFNVPYFAIKNSYENYEKIFMEQTKNLVLKI